MTVLTSSNQIPQFTYDPQAIATYEFPAALVRKLAEEQKWTADFTQRVLAEYRRFIHLAATARDEVTPSQVVDEAWHMHLTFSRDYWERLTPLLPAPLHHEPAEGLPGDQARYAEQYRRTLSDYESTFGEAPPSDIWRVAKPPRRKRFLAVPAIIVSAIVLMIVPIFAALSSVAMIVLGGLVFLLVGGFAAAMQPPQPPNGRKDGGGSCGGGSCGTAGCGYTGGDACDSSGSDGGSCGDSGGDGGSGCGGGCGGGGCGT